MAEAQIKLKVDTRELAEFAKRAFTAARVSSTAMSVGLNTLGDSVVAVMATNLSKETGLTLEEVRAMMRVKRATRGSLRYEVTMKRELTEDPSSLEGRRESKNFGTRRPGELVIVVSKQDELVCMDCEELAAAGPMPVEIAMQHVPKHPNCRCVIMPYVQKGKRLPVTMTTVSGTSSKRRGGSRTSRPLSEEMTIRQIAQSILDGASRKIKISLK